MEIIVAIVIGMLGGVIGSLVTQYYMKSSHDRNSNTENYRTKTKIP
jgi:hypothetical protein